jgi:phosphoglucosamine mutase
LISETAKNEIFQLLIENNFNLYLPNDEELGKNIYIPHAVGRYIEYIKSTFPKNLSLKGLKIALKEGAGIVNKITYSVFKELGCQIYQLSNPSIAPIVSPYGYFSQMYFKKHLLEIGADIGFTINEEGDQIILFDERGTQVEDSIIDAVRKKYCNELRSNENNSIILALQTTRAMIETNKKLSQLRNSIKFDP